MSKIKKKAKGTSGAKIGSIAKTRTQTYQSSSEIGYPAVSEYLDSYGTFDKDISKKTSLKGGQVLDRSGAIKVGDTNFLSSAYDKGFRVFAGGRWDRSGRTYTTDDTAHKIVRSGGGRAGYTYSSVQLKNV